jgi:glycosyltransferase involved in cell wall biosynthesis
MTEPLRIGLYTSQLPTADLKPGGVDVYVDRLAERLARRGHEVVVFSYSIPDGRRSYELRQLAPAATATSRWRRMFVAPGRLNRVDTNDLDVLHLHGDDWFYVRRRIPTVRTFHGSCLHEARHAARMRRRISMYATYPLELLSSRLATRCYGVIPGPGPGYRQVGYLPAGFELPPLVGVDRQDPPTVLFVGTWNGRKRGQLLQRTFMRDVRPRIPEARLVMVSDYCEPHPGVEFVARPSDLELAEMYRSAWVFCLPSSYEGFGMPYLEAMAHGTPVVATSNPGSRFVLGGGRHGLLVREGELGRRIASLLLDGARRAEMSQAARARAAAFGWDGVLDRHEQAYGEAIAAFRPAGRLRRAPR